MEVEPSDFGPVVERGIVCFGWSAQGGMEWDAVERVLTGERQSSLTPAS